jgi:asparagine N-glycosylation enzyme membrane subunit Stt3
MPKSRLFFLLCYLTVFPSFLYAEPGIPERFVYYIYWSGIRAGKATLVSEKTREGPVIRTRATSASFISLFYRVDDTAQSTLYTDGYPKEYILKLKEGRHRRDKATYFGTKAGNSPQKIIHINKLKDKTYEYYLENQAFDPLAGFFEIRKRPLTVGRSEYLDIFDSKKLWEVEVQVLRKEHIKTPLGEFDTILIKPLLQSEGIFLKKGEFHIWLTDDDKKIPVMVKSRVKIGNFTAKLIEGLY